MYNSFPMQHSRNNINVLGVCLFYSWWHSGAIGLAIVALKDMKDLVMFILLS